MRGVTSHKILDAYLGITWQSKNLHEIFLLSYAWPVVGNINRAWFKNSAKYLLDPEMAHSGLIWAKIKKSKIWAGEVRPLIQGKISRQIEWW